MTRLGVLLMAHGSPDSLDDVEDYYRRILHGRPIPPRGVELLLGRYRAIGGRSPLGEITRAQAAALENRLEGRARVFVAMKYSRPFIRDVVPAMKREGIDRAVGIALAPHYSRMSVEGYFEAVRESEGGPEISFVERWGNHPLYLQAMGERVQSALADFPDPFVLFTAHSLPERIGEWNDPYPEELRRTREALARSLELKDWGFAYQSAPPSREKWLGPDILSELDRLAGLGVRRVLIVPIGFLSDHLEVLYDIDVMAREFAERRGMTLRRVASLNDHPLLIQALEDLVRQARYTSRG